ncbi:DUF3267 domain-containing protein [Methanogenium sp. S4BF]|uniref:DUF3267 domain-containing protein n=1 Tax=Methanogenium sp. S4BF TaxID=1789226 RepID=UPI002416E1E2|nr:DUF3267 domain-containing protein [Methanogenium sp. S4BF]WFN34545.1 DUF3267 domain-containing protein [Methanogenium sp. S4BF]
MHFSTSLPEADPAREHALTDDGWILLKEPAGAGGTLLSSVPFMILAAGITLLIAAIFVPVSPGYFGLYGETFSLSIGLPAVLAIAGILVFHELIHLSCIPKIARAGHTYLGITCAGGFVVCEEILEKDRHLLISLGPFLTISVGGTIVCGLTGLLSPLVLAAFTLNALGSSVDLLTTANVLRQVPEGARITASGMHTYWKA